MPFRPSHTFVGRLQSSLRGDDATVTDPPLAVEVDWRLRNSASIVNVLIATAGRARGEHHEKPCDLVLRRFWTDFNAWLLPPRVAKKIAVAGDGHDPVAEALFEDIVTRFYGTGSLTSAWRVFKELIGPTHFGGYPEPLHSAGLLFASHMLLQSVGALDVRRASRFAGRHEPLGLILARMEEGGALLTRKVALDLLVG